MRTGGGGGAAAPLLLRIDRVCVCPELVSELAGAYPTFLSKSDHKCLVVSIAPQARPGVATRERIPTSFLSDDTLVSNLETRLRSQVTTGLGWWEDAHAKIRVAVRKDTPPLRFFGGCGLLAVPHPAKGFCRSP